MNLIEKKSPESRDSAPDIARSALALTQNLKGDQGLMFLLCADEHQATDLEAALGFFAPTLPVFHFPGTETLPYDVFSSYQDIVSQRLALLYRLRHLNHGIVIAAASTLLDRLPPPSYLDAHALAFATGDQIDLSAFRQRLVEAGYDTVGTVRQHGEFSVRGGIIDIYPMGSDEAYRIEIFDDAIESLRCFDIDSQRSVEKTERLECLPARAFPLDTDGIAFFRANFRRRFEGDPNRSAIYRDVSKGLAPAGVESYLPLFFEETPGLLDYLPEQAQVLTLGDVEASLENDCVEVLQRYEERCGDLTHPLLKPDEAYFDLQAVRSMLQRRSASPMAMDSDLAPGWQPDTTLDNDARLESFVAHYTDHGRRVLLLAESAGRREAIRDLLKPQGLNVADVTDWQSFTTGEQSLALCIGPLRQGLICKKYGGSPGIEIIPENLLTGNKPPVQRRRKAGRDAESILSDLADLRPGAPIVHQDHGVGRFVGMQSMTHGGVDAEYLTLEYADGAMLYVPVAMLHVVRRYSGGDAEIAPLHKLGSEQWSRARKKAAEKAKDAAAELLEQQARRAAAKGIGFAFDEQAYLQFCDDFPFEETEDQQSAIAAVIKDLQAVKPMDRVVCGDVGFGKTEVALRAAFVAAHAGYQVCVLAPTTLLAQQHERNFSDRFANWPISIAGISRLKSASAQQKVLDDLATGKVDIVVGTHRLLREDIRFHKLGLMIVDEEQRFGVKQKEQLKKLRADVDLLTLTATPIPRTLNMALVGMRDLSIIATPPVKRLPVQTLVAEWGSALIHEACLRELRRGGQVYFVHNRVEDIERIAREIRDIMPQASLAIAHGQMRERELEQVMLDFYQQRINILLCTTIIESGIDVPTANTIIINRADRFGLAQLHQLRGRVGRSHHRAYAYLLVPDRRSLKGDAEKRLDAIESMGELGAGFTLATHDMEIRGAGELLGENQSGHIEEIGFDLYLELLDRAVKSLRSGEIEAVPDLAQQAEIEIGFPALLPEDYVPDIHARLVLYKRISRAKDDAALRELKVELIDRFGLLPKATETLFDCASLRLKASPLGIQKIEVGEKSGRLVFMPKAKVDPGKLILMVQADSRHLQLNSQGVLTFHRNMQDKADRFREVETLLQNLSNERLSN